MVVIVGAGLAGLCCAKHLAAAGREVAVLEASDGVGGRVRTDVVDGFRLDRGFQVLQSAYPEARRVLDYRALDLRPYASGALVRMGGRFRTLADPYRDVRAALRGVFGPPGTLTDRFRIARLRRDVLAANPERMFDGSDLDTAAYLERLGFSAEFVERFLRPWFAGVFLESDLATSRNFFRYTFRMFAEGRAATPALGMGRIPEQIADGLPDGAVRFDARVRALEGRAVVLDSGERVEADAVVVAAAAPEARKLLVEELPETRSCGTACLYFAAERAPLTEPILVLDGERRGPVNNLVVPTAASPSLAPAGAALISASTVGIPPLADADLESAARDQLRGWFGARVDSWRHLRTYRIPHALPAQPPGALAPGVRPVRLRDGVFVCGDHREAASIQGAMVSGRRAAAAVLADVRC